MYPAIITCEHASPIIPKRYANLGLCADDLKHHIVWDKNIIQLARYVSNKLSIPFQHGRVSRLIVDLNRSIQNPTLIVSESFGVPIPGNMNLSSKERKLRISTYYTPYMKGITTTVKSLQRKHKKVYVWSFHSFAQSVDPSRKKVDIGILHDGHPQLAKALRTALLKCGWKTFVNRPYSGATDGINNFIVPMLGKGIEAIQFEFNTKLLDGKTLLRLRKDVTQVLAHIMQT